VIEKSVMAASFAVFKAIITAACDRYGHTKKAFFHLGFVHNRILFLLFCIESERNGPIKQLGKTAKGNGNY
jgi:hypothetical protein